MEQSKLGDVINQLGPWSTSGLGLPYTWNFFKDILFFKEIRQAAFILSWASAGGVKRAFALPGSWIKNQKFLGNLKLASWFRLIDSILAITLYLPVWHSHCTRARFTAPVWCSDELAVHSCPLRLQTQTLRNLRAHCSTVDLCCVTISWQRIFKGSLQVTIVMRFSACDCWPQTSVTGDAAMQLFSGVASPKFFGGPKNLG